MFRGSLVLSDKESGDKKIYIILVRKPQEFI